MGFKAKSRGVIEDGKAISSGRHPAAVRLFSGSKKTIYPLKIDVFGTSMMNNQDVSVARPQFYSSTVKAGLESAASPEEPNRRVARFLFSLKGTKFPVLPGPLTRDCRYAPTSGISA